MTDPYANIRRALEMLDSAPADETMTLAAARDQFDSACDPDTIRALLAERDALAADLEAAREDACVSLVADIRLACGDNGKRMQPELVEYIRGLAADAERYRWLRKGANRGANDDIAVVRGLGAMDYGMSGGAYTYSEEIDGYDLDAAIDQARGEGVAE